jgi:hypothetical protein
MRLTAILITALLTFAAPAMARDAPSPKATIADAAWLAGRWTGEGLGGQVQEGISDPVNGQMVGYFTLSKGGKTAFHELILIEEHAGSLRVRVKHFTPGFVAWEEKGGAIDFPLVSAAPGDLIFDGLTFRRDGEDGLVITVRFKTADGAGRDEVLRYRRAP